MSRPTSNVVSSLFTCCLGVGALACSKAAPAPTAPEHADAHGEHGGGHDGDHGHDGHDGHHGHQGQGHGVNEHGYKGHRFDDPQEWTKAFESEERTAWQRPDAVVESLGLGSDAKIADLGAGTGYFAVRFAAAAPNGKVYAVDIEPNMVAWLAERATKEGLANLEAVQGGPHDPQLPGPVDVVFMCDVFHHLADPKAYFEAVAGTLTDEGRVVIIDFREDNPEDAPGPPASMRLASAQIVEIMGTAGYVLDREDRELLEYQYLLEFRRAP